VHRGGGAVWALARDHTHISTTHRCVWGATLRYKQGLRKEQGGVYPTWKCKDCGTPVPGQVAERIRHQHPS
jgi:hypothetical protein